MHGEVEDAQAVTEAPGGAETGPTVVELVRERWGTRLTGTLIPRFLEPGWSYQEQVPRTCPVCERALHSLRRPYESQGRVYRYVAVVCPSCPAAYTLADLGVKTYDKLCAPRRAATAVTAPAAEPSPAAGPVALSAVLERMGLGPCPAGAGAGAGSGVTAVRVPRPAAPAVPALPAVSARQPRPAWPEDLPLPAEDERRRLLWCKVTDPAWRPAAAAVAAAEDVRVIVPDTPAFDALRAELAAQGIPCRSVRHWQESEQVGTVGDFGSPTDLVAHPARDAAPVAGPGAHAARDAFAAQWDALEELPSGDPEYVPVTGLVPESWAGLLSHPSFNPAQAAAVPAVLDGDEHLVVVAPTGAGKTPVGMVAALHAHHRGRKAAWLVPQRSLTDELDRELEAWRRNGLEVVRLTGESAVDTELVRKADVWIATTEKFEAICRAGSLRDALAEVGCLVVDEIHLLGDPTRGPVLEALLARVREDSGQVRIVGLSATVANADEVAAWLGARLIRTPWRPTRLTWQIPVLPAAPDADWSARAASRTETAVRLARTVTGEGGSVLVFCGSKRGVRATALALAADRGVPTAGADADDAELVERLCSGAGVRLHYRDWPYKREAEHAFRTRQADVLVATSTVAAGVNLPARAVVVRDTQIGLDRIEVSMVQQMFGRAGRVGAGEREGWAFLLADGAERAEWQARLAAGYTVRSRIRDRLPDHLLAEAVQGRLSTLPQAEAWWTQTLAFHQGQESFDSLHDAVDFLAESRFLRRTPGPGGDDAPALLVPTELGKLTSRFMVDSDLADTLTSALHGLPVPQDPDTAEDMLATLLSAVLPVLEQAPFTERARAALLRVLRTGGRTDLPDGTGPRDDGAKPAPGDLSRAVLLLVAHSPHAFRTRSAYVLGIPLESMTNILDEAERYLAWLGAQGPLGSVHPWAAVAASDLAARIRWRTLGPPRGSGRLLWMCEQMATPPLARSLVPQMWRAARERGVDAPDWPGTTPPASCMLPADRYRALLADRATGTVFTEEPGGEAVHVLAPPGAVVRAWNGKTTTEHFSDGSPAEVARPQDHSPDAAGLGAVAFTRGDRLALGWAAAYNAIGTRSVV
ncbi:DEAD/DEAH box helicase [Streptomyces sp. XH2]|uniref:DEAD/DEAH box helicase n=1 Tax=Streptomyces sp. XH2 TaxID=3412483 RepID=UPI003C79BB22